MSEFLNELIPILETLGPYLGTGLTALVCLVTFIFYVVYKDKKEKALREQLERARSRETYTKCTHCGAKLPLSEVTFYLPGDIRDNDLDGKPDN